VRGGGMKNFNTIVAQVDQTIDGSVWSLIIVVIIVHDAFNEGVNQWEKTMN